jgi:tubulin-specific chaperone B
MADVPLQVICDNSSSERRITPSWSVSQLKTKLEPITGIPASSQKLFLKSTSQDRIPVEGADEDATHLTSFPLIPYGELHVGQSVL